MSKLSDMEWESITDDVYGSFLQYRLSGNWFAGGIIGTSYATATVQENLLIAYPVFIPILTQIDKIGINVASAGLEGNARLGIYKNNSIDKPIPSSLLIDAGEVDITTTGNQTKDISIELDRGLYWLALVLAGSTPTLSYVSATSQFSILGSSSIGGTVLTGVTKSYTYDVLPDPFPNNVNYTGGGSFVFIRKAEV